RFVRLAALERQRRVALPSDVRAQRVADRRVEEVAEVRRLRYVTIVEAERRAIVRAGQRHRDAEARIQAQVPAGLDDGRQEVVTVRLEVDTGAEPVHTHTDV